jgi:hypothetical protein
MIRTVSLFLAVYLALIAQEFLPPLPFFDNARLLLVPVIFCYGALWLSFPVMLGLALWTGLLNDLLNLHIVGDRVEIGLGWSMLYYVFAGTILQALRGAGGGPRWEIHGAASAVVTFFLLLGQYLMVCLRRESFHFDGTVAWHIAGPPIAALFLAPVVYFFFQLLPGGPATAPGRGRWMRS